MSLSAASTYTEKSKKSDRNTSGAVPSARRPAWSTLRPSTTRMSGLSTPGGPRRPGHRLAAAGDDVVGLVVVDGGEHLLATGLHVRQEPQQGAPVIALGEALA